MSVNRPGPDVRAPIRDEIARALRGQTFTVPTYDGDPDSPDDGDMWIDGTAGTLRLMLNGTAMTVTLT